MEISVRTQRKLLMIFSVLVLSWGCAPGVSRNAPPAVNVASTAQPTKEPTSKAAPKPPPIRSMLVSPIDGHLPEPKELISFTLKDADVKDVLMGLSRMSRYNIVFEQDIAGKVSVDLKEVTLEEALKVLLPPMGLEFKRDGRMIQVFKPKLESRIFTLNYISTTRKGQSQISATSGGGGESAESTQGGTETGGSGSEEGDFSKVQSSDQADPWGEIRQGLKGLISKEGKFSTNTMAGIISVRDYPANLLSIANYLEAVEGSVHRQVIIEAEVLEITLTEDFEYGIDFVGGDRKRDPQRKIEGGGGLVSAITQAGIVSQILNPGTGIFSIGLADKKLSFLLDLLQKEGKLKVLSRPSISTLNNQKAIIKIATDDVFFETTTTITEGVAQTNVSSTTVTIGVVLSVTPQIASDGYIIMEVHPIVTDSTATRTFTAREVTSSRPVLDVRETNTVLRVKDGETIIIAGLIKEKVDRQVQEVPFLSKIPLLGLLFQQIDESKINTELVIKITPKIVVGSSP